MPYMHADQTDGSSVDLFYEDRGSGPPVVLIHGWPLCGASWSIQATALLAAGHRVITYDRRGSGQSGRSACGYQYDAFASDLRALIVGLGLSKVSLVGFSLGGGEVARYAGLYGQDRLDKAVFISSIPPFLPMTADNPDGEECCIFEGMCGPSGSGDSACLSAFMADFYNADPLRGKRLSDDIAGPGPNPSLGDHARDSLESLREWRTDFRADLSAMDLPTLVIHGDADRILPLRSTGIRIHNAVRGARLLIMEDGPHGLPWTHAREVNRALVEFLA